MSSGDFERAQLILDRFIDKTLSAVECDEFHLDLVFSDGARFQTHCSWRFLKEGRLLFGRGDVGGQVSKEVLDEFVGLSVTSANMTMSWDSTISFGQNRVVQAIADTVQYETWEAHLEVGSVIFSDGDLTIFPPAPTAAEQPGPQGAS